MALLTIQPTKADRRIADAIASRTTPPFEEAAELLTYGADEKVLLALATIGWLYALGRGKHQRLANHVMAVSLISSILPHLMKAAVDQIRPDRLSVRGHWRGIPFSGRPRDAFPSGHALHMGALASAAGLLSEKPRRALRAIAVGLSATRVLLLAHWASDVIAGFALGAAIERLLRHLTLQRH
jgi:undecaprenyl-diphosphatase